MRVALLGALCACNQVFDLDATVPRDAPDAAEVDALPTTCPPLTVVPRFQHELNQAFTDCRHFNVDTTGKLAMATCAGGNMLGPPDGPLVPSGLPANVTAPRPTPGGARVYALRNAGAITTPMAFESSGGTWSATALPFSGRWLSNVAADPDGSERVLVEKQADDLEEWVFAAASWRRARSISGADLKATAVSAPMMTSDGLRLVVRGVDDKQNVTMYYATRARPEDPFGTAQLLAEVPVSDDGGAYLTPDCTRIYVSGLQQVFFLRQQ